MSSLMLVYGAALLLRVVVWLSLRKWVKNPSPHLIYKARPLPPRGPSGLAQMGHKCVTNHG
jgi:hypothetical protein